MQRNSRRLFLKAGAAAIASISVDVPLKLFASGGHLLRAGVARVPITPPLSVPYLTSSANGTCAPFTGVHDPLYARALVFDDGRSQMAVLAVDAIGYDNLILGKGKNFTHELRKRIAARTDLRADSIMLTATHAHSTPETIGLTNFRDCPGVADWLEQHLETLADAVIAASKARVPVHARFGKATVEGIARNRRILLKNRTLSRYGPVPAPDQIAAPWFLDEDLSMLYFETEAGAPHSLVLNYTAHPVVTMLLPQVSADYPGAAASHIEKAFPSAVCLFTQGAAGNINSVRVSTRYEDASDLGRCIAEAAAARIAALKSESRLAQPSLQVRSKTIYLKPRDCPSVRTLKKLVASEPSPVNQRLLRLAEKLADDSLSAEIQAMRIGPVTWLSMAGASFVCGYANGWLGYFPLRQSYEEGGYEVERGAWSRVAPQTAQELQTEGQHLVRSIGAA
jgi:hypothetical protein